MTNPLEGRKSAKVEQLRLPNLKELISGREGDNVHLDSIRFEQGLVSGEITKQRLEEELGMRFSSVTERLEYAQSELATSLATEHPEEEIQSMKRSVERLVAMQAANPNYLNGSNMDFRIYGSDNIQLADNFTKFLLQKEPRAQGRSNMLGEYGAVEPIQDVLRMLQEVRPFNEFNGHPKGNQEKINLPTPLPHIPTSRNCTGAKWRVSSWWYI